MLYLPSGHMDAVPVVDPDAHAYPATHAPLHDAVESLDTDPNLPPGHSLQLPAPCTLYVPGKHLVCVGTVEPGGQLYPAVQLPEQLGVDWPVKPYRPASHIPEHDASVSPLVTPYWPASHGPAQEAVDRPSASPYKPAAHWVHDPAPAVLNVPRGHIDAVAFVDPTGHS